jgi:hypothetical protein
LSVVHRFNLVSVSVDDDENENIAEYFDGVCDAIEKHRHNNGKVLVYCGLGISRSASMCIAYFMKVCIFCSFLPPNRIIIEVDKRTLHDAYKRVRSCRSIICPNVGFFRQLLLLERQLFGCTSVTIIEPTHGVLVADVVWQEIYEEVMGKTHRVSPIRDHDSSINHEHIQPVSCQLQTVTADSIRPCSSAE